MKLSVGALTVFLVFLGLSAVPGPNVMANAQASERMGSDTSGPPPSFEPPCLTDPKVINVSAEECTSKLALKIKIPSNQDAVIFMPDSVCTASINIVNGRNIRLIGGKIVAATDPKVDGCVKEPFSCPSTKLKTVVRLTDFTGSFTVEGMHIDVNGNHSDAIHFRGGDDRFRTRDIYLRNLYIEGFTGLAKGVHADWLHNQGVANVVYAENISVRSGQNSVVLFQKMTGGFHIRNYDFRADPRFEAGGPLRCIPKEMGVRNCVPTACAHTQSIEDNWSVENAYCDRGLFTIGGSKYKCGIYPQIHCGTPDSGSFADPSRVGLSYTKPSVQTMTCTKSG